MNEIPACLYLEHVDLAAAELQMLRALFSRSLNLLLAFWRPRVQVLDARERRTFWGSNDHVWSALSDLRECPLATFVFAEIPDVAVCVGSCEIRKESMSHAHAICILHHYRRAVDFCEVAEALAHGPRIFMHFFLMMC